MEYKNNVLACALGFTLGVGVMPVHAMYGGRLAISLADFDGDGLQSDFDFPYPPQWE